MAKPVVAIVGRPNVGKSTLFNKIAGRRIAIVEDTPGVTRDRIYCEAEWNGRVFTLIDTGGIEPADGDRILTEMREQAQIAIDMACVIVLVVDVREGMTATDKDVAAMLQRSGKPVVVACSKCDTPGDPPLQMYDFYNLALGDPVPVSGVHGMGVGDLLDRVVQHFPVQTDEDTDDTVIKLAVVGKPNAGKSSLINHILGENRVIVSPVAGTTRDSIDTYYTRGEDQFLLIDTAGMRRRGKIEENIERYSVIRALNAIDRADVALLMIDAAEGVTEQDSKIAGYIHEQGKACLILINKWDLIDKDSRTMDRFRLDVQDGLSFMLYAPILFISAKPGQRVDKIFEMAKYVQNQNAMRISTGMLNDVLNDATARVQPPSDKGKRLKIYYMTQVSAKPPTFVLFINDQKLAHFSYLRYLENQLRGTFGFEGTPIRLIVREKTKD